MPLSSNGRETRGKAVGDRQFPMHAIRAAANVGCLGPKDRLPLVIGALGAPPPNLAVGPRRYGPRRERTVLGRMPESSCRGLTPRERGLARRDKAGAHRAAAAVARAACHCGPPNVTLSCAAPPHLALRPDRDRVRRERTVLRRMPLPRDDGIPLPRERVGVREPLSCAEWASRASR